MVSNQQIQANEVSQQGNDFSALKQEFENFAYIVSHDLQAPLRSVVNFSKLLQERYQNSFDEKGNKHFGYIIDGAERMQHMVDGLLRYSRLNTEKEAVLTAPLSDVLGKVHVKCKDTIAASNATLRIAQNLPDIHGEIERLNYAIYCLVDNAIKFQPQGQKPEIWIEAEARPDGGCMVAVRDNGIGINKDKFQEIFTIFRQLNKPSDYPGLGVGLTLAKKIVENHQGKIWVESEPGKGSTFFLTIPGRR